MGIFPQGKEYNMSFDTLRKVLDEGASKGLQSVVFTGGEPTMHPEIMDFIEYASRKNFPDISVITNGSMLTDKIIDCLLGSGVTRMNISLDSITPGIYEKVRGVNDYAKVMRNIERFLEKRKMQTSSLPLLSLSFVLSEDNASELDGFVKMWHERADGGIKIYPYKDIYSIMDDDFDSIYGARMEKPNDSKQGPFPRKLSHALPIMEKYSIKCTIPWYRCHVGVHGEIQACTTIGFCDHPLMKMGNIHEMTFEEAWKSERWKLLREITLAGRYDRHPVCKVCQESI
jgi:MoaA/NifB/PqqE/SkfB family radical SAM enzyme